LHLRQPLEAIVERAVAAWHLALGARKKLVPGGEAGPRAVDDYFEISVVPGSVHALLKPADGFAHRRLEERIEPCVLRSRPRSTGAPVEGVCLVPPRRGPRLLDEPGAFQELAGEIRLPSLRPPRHVVHPGAEAVRPGLNGEPVASVGVEGDRSGPTVVVDEAQGSFLPLGLVLRAVQDGRREHVVPLLEDIGGEPRGRTTRSLPRGRA